MPLANSTRLLVTTAADWYIEYSRVLDPGALRHTSDDRQMAHNDNTNSVSFTPPFFFFFFLFMGTTQNARPVMHATGGERLCRWMGACICFPPAWLADDRSTSLQLKQTPTPPLPRLALLLQPKPSLRFHLKSGFILYADEGRIILVRAFPF